MKCVAQPLRIVFMLSSLGMGMLPLRLHAANTPIELGTIQVSPARFSPRTRAVASSVSVISKEEIERAPAHDLLGLLEHYEGVYVERTSDYGRQEIKIRGLGDNGRRIQILINGRPEKQCIFGCTVTQTITLDNIERIEILRGTQYTLYGSDALGGAINIITKTEAPPERPTEISGSYGTFNTSSLLLSSGYSGERTRYFLTAGTKRTDGHRENAGFDGNDYTGRFVTRIGQHMEFSLGGQYFTGTDGQPGTVSNPTPDDLRDYKRGSLDMTLDRYWSATHLSVILYENYGHHDFTGSYRWHSKDWTFGAKAAVNHDLTPTNVLSVGMDFMRADGERLEPLVPGTWHRQEVSPYVYDEQRFLDGRVLLTLGGRYTVDSEVDDSYGYEAGLMVTPEAHYQIWTRAGRGIRTPKLSELYLLPPANEDLKAEDVTDIEAGVRYLFSRWFESSLSVYEMRGSNFIRTVVNTSPPPPVLFQNSDSFVFKGLETSMMFFSGQPLYARFAYTYQDSGSLTEGRPMNQFQFVPGFVAGALSGDLFAKYFTKLYGADNFQNRLDDAFTVDMKLSYRPSTMWELFLIGRNIFDAEYSLVAGYPMPGAAFEVGARLRF